MKQNIGIKKVKKTLSIALLTLAGTFLSTFAQTAQANDGVYYMSGNQLVPMHTTQIDVKKEVLDIRREGDDIVVDVHYQLYNTGKPVSLLVGFEAMPPSGDAVGLPNNGEHPYMKDFSAKVNGKSVQYDIALVPSNDQWREINGEYTLGLDQATSPFYFKNGHIKQETEAKLRARVSNDDYEVGELYVYHFSANFKSGRNTIDHSYRFSSSGTVGDLFNLDYVLTAINRWGDSTIDDFKLTLDMGELIEFHIRNSFFDHADEWKVEGVGKIYPTPKGTSSYSSDGLSTTFAIRSGKAVFHKRNFQPKGNLFLFAPTYIFYGEAFNPDKHDLSLNYVWMIENNQELSPFTKKVLRNFPFARRGYVFKNKKLQDYFQRQPWYIANPSYHADFSQLPTSEQQYIIDFK